MRNHLGFLLSNVRSRETASQVLCVTAAAQCLWKASEQERRSLCKLILVGFQGYIRKLKQLTKMWRVELGKISRSQASFVAQIGVPGSLECFIAPPTLWQQSLRDLQYVLFFTPAIEYPRQGGQMSSSALTLCYVSEMGLTGKAQPLPASAIPGIDCGGTCPDRS